jgi:hypothetical protein
VDQAERRDLRRPRAGAGVGGKHITNILAKLDLPPSEDSHPRARAVLAHLNR